MSDEADRIGKRYLTKTIVVHGLFGPRETRGMVEVTGPRDGSGKWPVRWLKNDGSERVDRFLPRVMQQSFLLAEVPHA